MAIGGEIKPTSKTFEELIIPQKNKLYKTGMSI